MSNEMIRTCIIGGLNVTTPTLPDPPKDPSPKARNLDADLEGLGRAELMREVMKLRAGIRRYSPEIRDLLPEKVSQPPVLEGDFTQEMSKARERFRKYLLAYDIILINATIGRQDGKPLWLVTVSFQDVVHTLSAIVEWPFLWGTITDVVDRIQRKLIGEMHPRG